MTTVPASFYNRHLHDQPIHSLHDLLQIEGAAGQAVPYLGYVDLSVIFAKDFLGQGIQVSTLALVVPDSDATAAIHWQPWSGETLKQSPRANSGWPHFGH